LAFSGQSNSLFFKEKDGQSDGSQQGKDGDSTASHFLGGVQAGGGANALGWAFRSLRGSAVGLATPNLLYRWKKDTLHRAGPAARTLGDRVLQLEEELRRVERERDILKKVAPSKAWERGTIMT
jgi:hypothetical protein